MTEEAVKYNKKLWNAFNDERESSISKNHFDKSFTIDTLDDVLLTVKWDFCYVLLWAITSAWRKKYDDDRFMDGLTQRVALSTFSSINMLQKGSSVFAINDFDKHQLETTLSSPQNLAGILSKHLNKKRLDNTGLRKRLKSIKCPRAILGKSYAINFYDERSV